MKTKNIGKMILFHRKQSRLSQENLAKMAGVGKTVIFDMEKGKMTIKLETLLKVFHVLNIKMQFDSPLMNYFKDGLDENS